MQPETSDIDKIHTSHGRLQNSIVMLVTEPSDCKMGFFHDADCEGKLEKCNCANVGQSQFLTARLKQKSNYLVGPRMEVAPALLKWDNVIERLHQKAGADS